MERLDTAKRVSKKARKTRAWVKRQHTKSMRRASKRPDAPNRIGFKGYES